MDLLAELNRDVERRIEHARFEERKNIAQSIRRRATLGGVPSDAVTALLNIADECEKNNYNR